MTLAAEAATLNVAPSTLYRLLNDGLNLVSRRPRGALADPHDR